MSSRFFSIDSPKAIKARGYGYVNAINYMAPASTAGVGNLCPHASAGCLALCLGWYSGQAGMLSNAELETGRNAARVSRQRKAVAFMKNRAAFMSEMFKGIEAARRAASRQGLKLCVRPNGATDIAWEGIRTLGRANRADMSGDLVNETIFDAFPTIQFVDYTKNYKRMLRFCAGELPRNYHLTFSRSETNEAECRDILSRGGNVAVVFAGEKPAQYMGARVIDGDKHDLRHLDPRGVSVGMGGVGGFVIALSPKGRKAKADTSGFVVRL